VSTIECRFTDMHQAILVHLHATISNAMRRAYAFDVATFMRAGGSIPAVPLEMDNHVHRISPSDKNHAPPESFR
jgi:hypothetical protein